MVINPNKQKLMHRVYGQRRAGVKQIKSINMKEAVQEGKDMAGICVSSIVYGNTSDNYTVLDYTVLACHFVGKSVRARRVSRRNSQREAVGGGPRYDVLGHFLSTPGSDGEVLGDGHKQIARRRRS